MFGVQEKYDPFSTRSLRLWTLEVLIRSLRSTMEYSIPVRIRNNQLNAQVVKEFITLLQMNDMYIH